MFNMHKQTYFSEFDCVSFGSNKAKELQLINAFIESITLYYPT